MIDYPERPQLFALHYIRWMIESGTASEAGPDAFALLVAVVMQEDQVRYARPPNFYNEQLCRHCGIGSIPALIRARNRAIELGLLEYEPAAKRRPGRYFVSGFPNDSLRKAEGIRRESVRNPTPSIPIPIPIPIPIKESGNRKRFTPPTVDEVREYCRSKGRAVDAGHFVDHYTANGWKQSSGRPIVDWQAAVRTWERNQKRFAGSTATAAATPKPVKQISPIQMRGSR